MADSKLINLTSATTPVSADALLYIVTDPTGTPTSKKVTIEGILSTVVNAASIADVHASTASTVAAAADNRVSVLSGIVSALDVTLSARINSVETHASTASTVAAAADNRVSVLSGIVSAVSLAVTSVKNEQSARVDTVSNLVSVLNAVSARSIGASVKGSQSALNALSNTISNLRSQQLSTDQRVSTLSATVSVNASLLNSIASAISLVSVQTAGGSATGLQNAINFLNQRISTVAGGAGSVTSAELLSVKNVSVLDSAGVSVEGLQSALNALSGRMSAVELQSLSATSGLSTGALFYVATSAGSAQKITFGDLVSEMPGGAGSVTSIEHASVDNRVSVLSGIVSTLSAAHNTLSNVVSGVVSGVSARSVGDVSTRGVQSIVNALSNRISATDNRVSTLSGVVSAVSLAVTSVKNEQSARVDTVSNLVSALTSAHNALSNVVSGIASAVSARSVGDVSTRGVQSIVNALSNRISATDNRVSTLSATVSLNQSILNSIASAISLVSVQTAAGSATGLQNVVSFLNNRISLVAPAGGSAVPTSAAFTSTNSIVTSIASLVSLVSANSVGVAKAGLQSAFNAISNTISAAKPITKVVGDVQVISASALTNVSGLNATVSAGGVYKLEAFLMVIKGAAGTPTKYGLTFPAMKHIRGKIYAALSATFASTGSTAASLLAGGAPQLVNFEGDSASGSTLVTGGSAALLSTFVVYNAVMKVSTTGTVQIQAAGAAGASAISIQDGSYLQIAKLA